MGGNPARDPGSVHDPIEETPASRRRFLLGGLGLLIAGCSSPPQAARTLPGPAWDMQPVPGPARPGPGVGGGVPAPPPSPRATGTFLSRARWAEGGPVPALMNRMLPIRYVTVHHDGMTPFYGDTTQAASARLEAIRRAHRRAQWGDIGYHFAVDRAGNVWEARPLVWQGAHVKFHNEGNIGVVALGNFDAQSPTDAQLHALHRHVNDLMRAYGVPAGRLRTHMEWAPTRCPGRNLQRYMVEGRGSGAFG